jgi:hypothetical protein
MASVMCRHGVQWTAIGLVAWFRMPIMKMRFMIGTALAGTVLWVISAALFSAALVTGLIVAVVVVRTHPRVADRECGGRGRHYSRVLPWHFRMCSRCGGNGRVLSSSVRVLGTARQRDEYRRAAGERARQPSRFRERLP